MKRVLTCLTAVFIALSLTACAEEKTPEPSPTPTPAIAAPSEAEVDSLIEKSLAFAEQMVTGDFKSVTEFLSDSVKAQLTPEVLKEAWDDTVGSVGDYIGVYECTNPPANGYTVVNVILEYEKSGVSVSFMYEYSGLIGGLWLNYYNFPSELEENELFDEHNIQIGLEDLKLDGVLTLPVGEVKEIVILVHGSGQHDMDETIGASGNKPFRDIAHGLAERGIASVRYNKRYYQYMSYLTEAITIKHEVLDDVGFAVDFVKADERLKDMKITLIGHSLGGMLAPRLASENSGIDRVVILAGSPRGLEDIILDQNLAEIEKIEFGSEDEKNATITMVETEVNRIKNVEDEEAGATIMGIGLDYWKSLGEVDAAEVCKSLDIPFLIMQGDADFQVYADIDFEAWKEVFKDRSNAEFKLYDGLNHLFMPTQGIAGIADYDESNNVAPEVTEDIADWIFEN